MEHQEIYEQVRRCVTTLYKEAKLPTGAVVVLGCSSSEVCGARIGKGRNPEVGGVLAAAFLDACRALGLSGAVQCCEHLNRALVMERETLSRLGLTQVNARPVPEAGGSTAAAAYEIFRSPVLAQSIQADAAIDIGDTLVGMHIRPVAVPLRMEDPVVGHARVVMAYARLPLIGGSRAVYP
ncbi:MAG TPA: TIGR01440 family protein [Candidatus Limiplasma sp.]|nr:TIGR01440 family protein [Candidatus Limiplasma sp.]HRX08954.1 TIGR01440 family protein [Candidatus Limiplasma sp.]